MFQSSTERFRTWLQRAEEFLADPLADERDHPHSYLSHPHRRPLRWERDRRPGTVARRPEYCISPVRHSVPDAVAPGSRRETAGRS